MLARRYCFNELHEESLQVVAETTPKRSMKSPHAFERPFGDACEISRNGNR